MKTDDPARAEIALADGNVLHVGGGTRLNSPRCTHSRDPTTRSRPSSSRRVPSSCPPSAPRTRARSPASTPSDASVYANAGARVRVNADLRRGTVGRRAGRFRRGQDAAGSYTVRAGNYLLAQGDSEPEIARGSFSRDRFDLWAADRLEADLRLAAQRVEPVRRRRLLGRRAVARRLRRLGLQLHVLDQRLAARRCRSAGRPTRTAAGTTPTSACPGGPGIPGAGTPTTTATGSSTPAGTAGAGPPATSTRRPGSTGGTPARTSAGARRAGTAATRPGGTATTRTGLSPRLGGLRDQRPVQHTRTSTCAAGTSRACPTSADPRAGSTVTPGTRVVDRLGSDFSVSSRPIVLADRGRGGVQDGLSEPHPRSASRHRAHLGTRDSQRLAPVLARQSTLAATTPWTPCATARSSRSADGCRAPARETWLPAERRSSSADPGPCASTGEPREGP